MSAPVDEGRPTAWTSAGRSANIGLHLSAHSVNPALQPVLSRIPAVSLEESYELGKGYQYGRAFLSAATAVAGVDLARLLQEDILYFQDVGLEHLGKAAQRLRRRYGSIDHDAAREIIAWLDGEYVYKEEIG